VAAPLRTDYTANTQTDFGTHADAHNEANARINGMGPILDDLQVQMAMEVSP